MTVFTIPALEEEPWPTLGPQVCSFIETNLVFGPGDLRGQRAKIDPEKRALIFRMYEVYPEDARDANGKSVAGRRRFRRCCWSAQKGSAKTELAAWIAAAELSPEGPVRCAGFSNGKPIGRPVVDPYIPMVAYTEEQSEDLAYSALKTILEMSAISSQFDIGLERIIRSGGDGKAVALAGSPDARDGARTTWAHKDETHRWTLGRLKRAAQTMIQNLPKRLLADPWEFETTTAYSPGEGSVAEDTAEYARAVAEGRIRDSRLFYFHRQARDGYDLKDPIQMRLAVEEACGPTVVWKDVDGICDMTQDPKIDMAYWERVYLNRPVQTSRQAFDSTAWGQNAHPGMVPNEGLITLGFDGGQVDDTTALIATHVELGFQWPLKIWEAVDMQREGWKAEVTAAVVEAFARFKVWRMLCDPWLWQDEIAGWAGKFAKTTVLEYPTNQYSRIAPALKAYADAISSGTVLHDGNPVFASHIGQAIKLPVTVRDDTDEPLWTIQKERPHSPKKIDAAMAGCLSWKARLQAIEAGVLEKPSWSGIFIRDDDDEG